jgi:hypothetical protein
VRARAPDCRFYASTDMKMMLCTLGTIVALATTACGDAKTQRPVATVERAAAGIAAPAAPQREPASEPLTDAEKQLYRDIAKTSWIYLDTYYQRGTGFVNATPEWANTTLWDIGGQIIAYVAAKELGLIPAAEFDKRMRTTLGTLEKVPLFRGAAYNKLYATKSGSVNSERNGWSATDLGRFLLALKILAVHEPGLAAQAERVARRNKFDQIVKNGYLQGQVIGSSGKPWTYQEGRIGYEQYMARGFAEWGADVKNALDVNKNAKPVDVLGVKLLTDTRYNDRLLSEPFVLLGLEAGLTGDMRELAANMLKVQEARYKKTGIVTMVSEDAVSVPPEYFYYYCVYCSGKSFIIDASTPGKALDSPRWVSTKAAYGWHALMPNEYTKTAVDYVSAAKDPKHGWASGVYEGKNQSTNTFDINTAAVMMEVAFYRLRGNRPLIELAPVTP